MENNGFFNINLQRSQKYGFSKVWLAVWLVVAVCIVGGVVALVVHFTPRSSNIIDVVGFPEAAGHIPGDTKADFASQLYNQLALNFEVPFEYHAVEATVRADTFEIHESDNVTSAKFIVDIDAFKQTLEAVVSWSETMYLPENVVLNCTRRNLMKFPETDCYGMYSTSDSVSLYLPYSATLASGKVATASYDFMNGDGVEQIAISVNNCGDEAVKNEALAMVKNWLGTLGFEAEDFIFEVPSKYENCVVKGGN